MTDLRLRPATMDDLDMLMRWDAMPHVRENAGDDGGWDWRAELPRDVDWQEMLIAELADPDGGDGPRPIGFLQIIDPAREETGYWGDQSPGLRAIDIWVGEPDCLNRGNGSEMMRQAFRRCFANPEVRAILIDPLERNAAGRRFYERLGFRFVECRRFGTDDCAVYRLTRADWQACG